MNRDDVIRWAREAGIARLPDNWGDGWWQADSTAELERFAALVAAAEREACAYRAGIALLGADRGLANRVDQSIRARKENT